VPLGNTFDMYYVSVLVVWRAPLVGMSSLDCPITLTRFERMASISRCRLQSLGPRVDKSSWNYMRWRRLKSISVRTLVHLVLNKYMGLGALGARAGLGPVPMIKWSTAKNVVEYH
jgi:hypothetical protein